MFAASVPQAGSVPHRHGFTRADHFRATEPRQPAPMALPAFMALREKWDPKRRLRSAQSQRMFGDTA
jgi:hypothetical protein